MIFFVCSRLLNFVSACTKLFSDLTFDPTQPKQNWKKTRPNPTRGFTQPMYNSGVALADNSIRRTESFPVGSAAAGWRIIMWTISVLAILTHARRVDSTPGVIYPLQHSVESSKTVSVTHIVSNNPSIWLVRKCAHHCSVDEKGTYIRELWLAPLPMHVYTPTAVILRYMQRHSFRHSAASPSRRHYGAMATLARPTDRPTTHDEN